MYGDEALDNALNTFVKLLLSIPQTDLLDYPKLSQTYYVLLECLAQDHMAFLATLEPQVFLYILASISEGLQALGGSLNYFTGTGTKLDEYEDFSFFVPCIYYLLCTFDPSNIRSLFLCSVDIYILFYSMMKIFAADTMVCTGCCATLDHIVTYLFKKVTNKGELLCKR